MLIDYFAQNFEWLIDCRKMFMYAPIIMSVAMIILLVSKNIKIVLFCLVLTTCCVTLLVGTIKIMERVNSKICTSFGLEKYSCGFSIANEEFPNQILLRVETDSVLKNSYNFEQKKFTSYNKPSKSLFISIDTPSLNEDITFEEIKYRIEKHRPEIQAKIDSFLKNESIKESP